MNQQAVAAITDLLHADKAMLWMFDEAKGLLSEESSALLDDAVEDHRRHEQVLSSALEDAEMQTVEASEDMLALLDEHKRHIRAARDEADVLDALALAERLNAVLYEAAGREELPEELGEAIAANHADVRMHASLIAERAPQTRTGGDHNIACMTGGMTDDRNPDDFE